MTKVLDDDLAYELLSVVEEIPEGAKVSSDRFDSCQNGWKMNSQPAKNLIEGETKIRPPEVSRGRAAEGLI